MTTTVGRVTRLRVIAEIRPLLDAYLDAHPELVKQYKQAIVESPGDPVAESASPAPATSSAAPPEATAPPEAVEAAGRVEAAGPPAVDGVAEPMPEAAAPDTAAALDLGSLPDFEDDLDIGQAVDAVVEAKEDEIASVVEADAEAAATEPAESAEPDDAQEPQQMYERQYEVAVEPPE